jgi:hypothetical protein
LKKYVVRLLVVLEFRDVEMFVMAIFPCGGLEFQGGQVWFDFQNNRFGFKLHEAPIKLNRTRFAVHPHAGGIDRFYAARDAVGPRRGVYYMDQHLFGKFHRPGDFKMFVKCRFCIAFVRIFK